MAAGLLQLPRHPVRSSYPGRKVRGTLRVGRRLTDAIVRFGRWSAGADVRPLVDDERLIIQGGLASLLQGLFPGTGSLRLTDRRLIYMPFRAPYIPAFFRGLPVVEIQLSDIVALRKGRWLRRLWGPFWGVVPFVVELRDGRALTVQAPFPGTWQREIADAAKLGPTDWPS